eukprot:1139082-Pelagomonas_calceolata.AAC.3
MRGQGWIQRFARGLLAEDRARYRPIEKAHPGRAGRPSTQLPTQLLEDMHASTSFHDTAT